MDEERLGFEKPNHTQTPNSFFDVSLPKIKTLAELKVILAIIRQTFGWHKVADQISLSQLEKSTGLSRESVSNGINAALENGYIERKSTSKQGYTYQLKVVNNSDQSTIPTSQQFRPELVKDSDQLLVNNSDPQKKGIKEKKEIDPVVPFTGVAFVEALKDFLAHHREIGKPYKPTGLKALYAKLASWGESGATESLRESVSNRWQGVFPPKTRTSLPLNEHPNAYRPGKMVL